jgi:hypothetical protein
LRDDFQQRRERNELPLQSQCVVLSDPLCAAVDSVGAIDEQTGSMAT